MIFSIADKLENVRARIQKATISAKRSPDSVRLLAVSKTCGAPVLHEAMRAGQQHFGENYVNEALAKQQALQTLCEEQHEAALFESLVWHFIGPIQSNKTRAIAEHFSWVHGVDRSKIAQRLNDQRPGHLGPLNCCIQVNIDAEASKSGLMLDEVNSLAAEMTALPNLCLRGLMCIPDADQGEQALRQSFIRMATKFAELQQQYATVDTLSMGMSEDLELAIDCGSTMVRIGTALFGKRA
jgi:pyridoxal phosphate enzyme (YggS family)